MIKRRLRALPVEQEAIAQQRQRIEGLAQRFLPNDKRVVIKEGHLKDVAVEHITPTELAADLPNHVVYYIHGGAFILCSPRTHRGITAPLARYTGCEVVAVQYRLCPEHPYPAAVSDVVSVYRALLETRDARQITIAGDSAGGNLVLALLHAAREAGLPMPASAVCLSPLTDLTGSGESIRTNIRHDVLLPGERMVELAKLYLDGAYIREPTASPLFGDFDGFPPMLFHVGDREILLDDSLRVIDKIRHSGGEAHCRIWPDLPHVFHAFSSYLPVAHQALQEVADFMSARFKSAVASR